MLQMAYADTMKLPANPITINNPNPQAAADQPYLLRIREVLELPISKALNVHDDSQNNSQANGGYFPPFRRSDS